MKPWFERDPELYSRVERAIEQHFPTLHVTQVAGAVYIRGRLNITSPELRAPIASYDIELEFPPNYPEADPVVREIGGAIPKNEDHHFQDDGVACLFLPEERWRYCRTDITITEFINGPVRGFFAWQAHLALTGRRPPSGERRHRWDGVLDFYFEQIGTRDPRVIGVFLEYMAAKKLRGTWRCYCGSGQQLRQCHFAKVQFLRKRIPRKRALEVLQLLRQAKDRAQK
jgi:hypothetical protein